MRIDNILLLIIPGAPAEQLTPEMNKHPSMYSPNTSMVLPTTFRFPICVLDVSKFNEAIVIPQRSDFIVLLVISTEGGETVSGRSICVCMPDSVLIIRLLDAIKLL